MRKMLISMLVIALISSATIAFSAVKEGSFSATSMIGGYIYGEEQYLKSTLTIGARAGYSITKAIAVEALYDYVIPTDSKNLSYAPAGVGHTNISLHRFGGQALYHFFPDNVLVPYLAAGFSGVKLTGSGVDFAFDYGAGTKYFLTDDIAVRGDIRHILYGNGSGTANNVEFTLGACFQFGGITPAAKAVVTTTEQATATELSEDAADAVAVTETVKVAALPASAPAPVIVEAPQYVVPDAAPMFIKIVGEYPSASEPVKVAAAPLPVPSAGVQPPGAAVNSKSAPAQVDKRCCKPNVKTTVLFDADKVNLKARYHKKLDEVGTLLKENPGSKVTISGHTSAVGSKDTNLELSQLRAEMLRKYIVNKFGIDGSRIISNGFGSDKPVATNKTASGRSKNRRLDVIFSCE